MCRCCALSLPLPLTLHLLPLTLTLTLTLPISLSLSPSLSALISRTTSELRTRINEVQEKYNAAAIEMEQSVRETLMQERAAEKIRDTAAMQRKVSHHIHHIHLVITPRALTFIQYLLSTTQLMLTYVPSLQPSVQRSLDVQAVRTEERRTASREIESLRCYYTERERQTSDDLLEIEKLHADRYDRCRFSSNSTLSSTLSMSMTRLLVCCTN